MSTILNQLAHPTYVELSAFRCARRRRGNALACILLSAGFSLFWSLRIGYTSHGALVDFKAVFYAARCLIHHVDPYQPSRFVQLYRAQGGAIPTNPVVSHSALRAISVCINLPSSLLLMAPIAFLPWSYAAPLWVLLEFLCLVLAAFLAWDLVLKLAGNRGSSLSLILICVLLVNSELLLSCGNLAGVVIGLCVVAVWCFLQQRFVVAGTLCLAMSLAMKPHDVGFIWLCLLAMGSSRKAALRSGLLAAMLCIPGFLWASHVAPHWLPELRFNLLSTSSRGDLNDPGPSSLSGHSAGAILNLQSVLSVFRDDPRIYNPITYAICGVLLLAVLITTFRSSGSPQRFVLAIAAIVPLSLLIAYHRPYDAKLLLLTVPACAVLWARSGALRWSAFLLHLLAILSTGDVMLAIEAILTRHISVAPASLPAMLLSIVCIHFAPLTLFAMGLFYLNVLLWDAQVSGPRHCSLLKLTQVTDRHASGLTHTWLNRANASLSGDLRSFRGDSSVNAGTQ